MHLSLSRYVPRSGQKVAFQPSGAADRANAVVRLQGPPALDRGVEALGIETGCRQAGVSGSVLDETVRNADLQERQRDSLGGEELGDGGAGATLNRVLLESDEGAVATGEIQNQGFVEGLDEAHVDQGGIQPLG